MPTAANVQQRRNDQTVLRRLGVEKWRPRYDDQGCKNGF